ncbi:S8 family serine peptidase [Prosthecobacter dejongeii]|uniref:Subtilisin family serine protease/subtilisin-like proprotein convertase family protein n=1 Tax=Prosthecobacter dejongeii TaxID=48465 RepID=A0A7W7YNB5_9BACT|nr:S8 family serine peptidase [Prosthecobacter dejongeii]MBB5039340.1 subtilisin family serine protease/subtilisin-like proprotein convertase family protein [Prosthecobacter dejongeii]
MVRLPHFSRRLLALLSLLGLLGVGLWSGPSLTSRLSHVLQTVLPPDAEFNSQEVLSPLPEEGRQSSPGLPISAAGPRDKNTSEPQEVARLARQRAGKDLRAGRSFAMNEHGQLARFRLALDELYDATAPVHQRLRKIATQSSVGQLLSFAQNEAERQGRWPGLVIYPEDRPADAAHRRVLTEQVLVKAADVKAAEKLANSQGLKITKRPEYAKQHFIADAADPLAAVDAIAALDGTLPLVEPLLMRQRMRRVLLDDPYLRDQWHLKNTGQSGGKVGVDIGIEGVWDSFQGQGIRIAIVDDGLQLTHPDLAENVDPAPNHYDWNEGDLDPNPNTSVDFHGTAVGGVVAARGNNNLGVSGVAPQATLVGFRLIAGLVTDETEAESATRGASYIEVKNNSWGLSGSPSDLVNSGSLMAEAMAYAATTGRSGRGTVSVWASGNGRHLGLQGNKDPYSNNMHTIAVGAVTHKGVLTFYSETGSHLCVVAPSAETKGGIVTTDITGISGYNTGSLKNLSEVNYTNDFNGTSAATPVVSGVVALMLQANPYLNWRDVKEILLRSSTQIQPKDKGWLQRPNRDVWEQGFAPIKHHHFYGGGMIHAPSAVAMAQAWPGLGTMISIERTQTPELPIEGQKIAPLGGTSIIIPLPEETKAKTKATRVNVDFSGEAPLRVENVTVKLSATHSRRGDLTLQLVSPSGTVSTLASYSKLDIGANYSEWTFSSVRHWGESSRGIWSLVASEPEDDVDGELGAVTITLHGISYPGIELTSRPTSQIVAEGSALALEGATTTYGKTEQQWLKADKPISGQNSGTLSLNPVQLSDAGIYSYTAENLTTSIEVPVVIGVVRRTLSPQHLLPGKTATFKVTAAGPALRYQWFIGSLALRDDGRITGSRTPTLTIRRVQTTDAEDYYCRISMGDFSPLDTLRGRLSIMKPPTLEDFVPPETGIVSAYLDLPILADNGATSYRVTGLPPGVKLDARNGRLIGRPAVAGTYRITIIASNAAGASPPMSFDWVVEDLPTGLIGTYRGLVEPNDLYNNGYGGSLVVNIGKTGAFTGTLIQGKARTPLKGWLDTYPGETFATVNLSLPRPGSAPPLEFTFTVDSGRLDGSVGHSEEEYTALWAQREWTALPEEMSSLTGTYHLPLITQQTTLNYPQGSGYLALSLTQRGRMSYVGRLADGTTLSGGGTGTSTGLLPIHHLLYSSTGSVQGTLALVKGLSRFEAQLEWVKSQQASGTRNYGTGFPRHPLNGLGSRYTPPVAGGLLLDLPMNSINAQLDFSKGGLYTDFTQYFTLASGNIAQFPTGANNPHQLKMTLNAKTGLVTGSGTKIDIDPLNPGLNRQRPGTFSGLIIPHLNRAEGYFLLPGSSAPESPIYSGHFVLRSASN